GENFFGVASLTRYERASAAYVAACHSPEQDDEQRGVLRLIAACWLRRSRAFMAGVVTMPDESYPSACCGRPAVWGGTWSEGYAGKPETWRRVDSWHCRECGRAWSSDADAIGEARP